jgi:hypothetical protein
MRAKERNFNAILETELVLFSNTLQAVHTTEQPKVIVTTEVWEMA